MVYVMSDLHGNYTEYMKMLDKIAFSDNDLLYIVGDIIDRGDSGMKIILDIMKRPNIITIMGNHEYIALGCMSLLMRGITKESLKNLDETAMIRFLEWMNLGGSTSMSEFNELSLEEKEEIMEFISNLEAYSVVKVNDKKFVLVHAGLDKFSLDREIYDYNMTEFIFAKTDYNRVYFKDKYLVTGHIPTRIIHADQKGLLLEELDPSEYQDTIFIKNNHIAIDCGMGYGGQLGCLCLDTMEEFYVGVDK